jgi:MFS family permease
LARFSEAFLVLRAQSVGLALGYVPVIMIVMNVVYAASAYPAGMMADQASPRSLLIMGLVVLVVADIVLAAATSPLPTFIGAALWGLHMGLSQGLFAKLIADTAPASLRGTAFGIFNLFGGVALLMASAIAGALWSAFGASAMFLAGAAFATLALLGLIFYRRNPSAIQKGGE